MNICYFSTLAPCGKGETFVLNEISQIMKSGNKVTVIPVRPKFCYREEDYNVWCINPFEFKCFFYAVRMFLSHPVKSFKACLAMVFKVGGIRKGIKNLIFINKALASAWHIKTKGDFDFIHAHWLATTSSVAYIVSQITGIPFGITGHRFDVYENNGIAAKASKAAFIRTIDINGKNHVFSLVAPADENKVVCIHLGVDIPAENELLPVPDPKQEDFTLCVPANLIPVKGHKYIVEAFEMLKERGINGVKCIFFGEGELRQELEAQIGSAGLCGVISLPGYVSNRALIQKYQKREIDAVLLASVDLGGGMHEGIPVCLMEAMAFKIPVISTATGGIPELINDGAGCVIKEKSGSDLADAIEKMVCDRDYYISTANKGYDKVKKAFNNETNTKQLIEMINNTVAKIKE